MVRRVSSNGLAGTTFFGRTYDEALALTVETRNYLAATLHGSDWRSDARDQLARDCETLRLTTRLAQVMAWLLAQRALHAGEISLEEARSDEYRLSGSDVCLEQDPEVLATLPKELRILMEKSLALYQRVARLDQMVRRDKA